MLGRRSVQRWGKSKCNLGLAKCCSAFLEFAELTPQKPFVAAVGYADLSDVICIVDGMISARWWNTGSVLSNETNTAMNVTEPYLTKKELMLAGLGTRGDTQVTSMLSEPTRPKRRSVGAGTANQNKGQGQRDSQASRRLEGSSEEFNTEKNRILRWKPLKQSQKWWTIKSEQSQHGLDPQARYWLTGLLGDGGGLTLAVFRHRNHSDVVVDARLQPVDCVFTSVWQDKVLKNGYALPGCHHCDSVAGDGGGVEGWPAQTDARVVHVLEGDVRQLGDVWRGGAKCRQRERKTRTTPNERGAAKRKWVNQRNDCALYLKWDI